MLSESILDTVVVAVILLPLLLFLFISMPSATIGKWVFTLLTRVQTRLYGLRTRTLQYNDQQICFYDNESDRPPLLLLHGLSADKTVWLDFIKALHKDYRIIVPDLLGHGDSTYSNTQTYSSQTFVTSILALVKHLQLDKYFLVGNSMGGALAALLMEKDGERCKKLVLVGPAGAQTDLTMHMVQEKYNPFQHDTVQGVMDMYNLVLHKKPFIPKSVLYYFAEHNYIARYEALSHLFNDFVNADNLIDEKLDIESKDVLYIWGEEDYFTPTSDVKKWQTLVAGSMVQYEGIGHMTMVETPKRTAKDVHHFLSEVEHA
jgi:pimeloyl-ACP methyl ester carboxylesterase